LVYASGSDLIESRNTQAIGKRTIRHAKMITACFAIGASLLRLRARRDSGLRSTCVLRRSVSVRMAI
jgi:hypothetical protein